MSNYHFKALPGFTLSVRVFTDSDAPTCVKSLFSQGAVLWVNFDHWLEQELGEAYVAIAKHIAPLYDGTIALDGLLKWLSVSTAVAMEAFSVELSLLNRPYPQSCKP